MTKRAMPRYVHWASRRDGALCERKSTFAASSGDTTLPIACTPWEKLRRISAYCGGPHNALNGFAAISSVESPRPTIKLEIRKAGKEASTADGQKIRVPQP